MVVSGENHFSAVLKEDGSVHASGYNHHGDLGDSSSTHRYKFIQVVGPKSEMANTGIKDVKCGAYNTFPLKNDVQ